MTPVLDVRDRLAHILWIGGAPCAGKSSVSRVLAEKYEVSIYDLDWHYAREDRFRSGPAARWWGGHTLDERWVDIAGDELFRRSTAVWNEQFPSALEDLRGQSGSSPIIVEGPGALPWLVAPVLHDSRQAIFLMPDESFRDRVVADRLSARSGVPYWRTRDPDQARSKHRERDRRLSQQIELSCRDLGLSHMRVSDGTNIETIVAAVEQHFARHLPKAPPRR
jgi:hypothetical protein